MSGKIIRWLLLILVVFFAPELLTKPVSAQVCYPQRVINQHRCQGGSFTCTSCSDPQLGCYQSDDIGTICYGRGFSEQQAYDDCLIKCQNTGLYPGQGCASAYCIGWEPGTATDCKVEDKFVGCTAAPDCKAVTDVVSCSMVGQTCVDTVQTLTYGCWAPGSTSTPTSTVTPVPTPVGCGNGSCGVGENCSNCISDCGACPTPVPTLPPGISPTPTSSILSPTPTPGGPCGNGVCGAGENCSNCPSDCLACPTLTPTPTPITGVTALQSRSVMMNATDDCPAVRGSTTAIPGATVVHSFSVAPAPSPFPLTQSGVSYVSFPPSTAGTYTIANSGIPQNYVLKKPCYLTNNPATAGEALSLTTIDQESVRWDLGYALGTAWVQTQGGDVYASATLKSLVPNGISPRVFNLDSSIGYPGVVTYGTSYDFDIGSGTGSTLVSSKNWLVNESYASSDYYQTFWRRFGAPITYDYTNQSFTSPPAGCDVTTVNGKACYVSGTLTVSGNWNIGSGSYVFIVDGNLLINGSINLTGTGFVSFIVKNDITVASSVGLAYNTAIPSDDNTLVPGIVEGIYITGPTGVFHTGTSATGTERFVGKGSFIAGDFRLERDLVGIAGGQNTTTAAELFIYNPRLLIAMPDAMEDLPITWEEIAP